MASSRSSKRKTVRAAKVLPVDRSRRARDLSGLTLDGRPLNMLLGDRLTGAKLDRAVEGSSTVSLDVWDGDRAILNSSVLGTKLMNRDCQIKLDGLAYNVSGISKNGDQLTLTGEDQIVVDLKRHGKKKPVRAKNVTAPQFCAQLVRQAGKKVVLLESTSSLKKSTTKKSKRRAPKRVAAITVKGRRADAQQKRVLAEILETASDVKGARGKPLVALIAAIIVECECKNTQGAGPDAISFGVIQAIPGRTAGPKGTFTKAQALSIPYSVRAALLAPGPTSSGGLIAGHKKYPEESIGKMADRAINGLGVGDPDYVSKVNGRKAEAEAIIRAFDAGLLGEKSESDGPRPKATSHSRKRGESTWACCVRLLGEINWRIFVREGTVVIASDPALYRASASFTVDRDTDFWNPDFEWARGLKVNELTGQIAAARYTADPGETVRVQDPAQVDDKWLLASTTVDLLNPSAPVSLNLRKPHPPTAAQNSTGSKKAATSSQGDAAESSLRDKIVELAKKSLTENSGHRRYSQAGALTSDPTPPAPARTDCSQWVRAIYLRAGAPDPGTWTGDQYAKSRKTSRPKPGDLVLYPRGSGTQHVELYVGPGKRTIGHGSAPIDYGSADMLGGGEYRTFDFLDK